MNEEVLQKLYNNGSQYFSLPDFETFKTDMQDETKLTKFRESMSKHFSIPDIETFKSDIGFNAGKQEGVQTAAATAAPVTPEEPQQSTTFQQPSPLLEQEPPKPSPLLDQELPIGVAAPKTEKDILFERDKGKMLSAADPKAFTPEDYATKKTNEDIARKYIKDNESNALWAFNDEEGLLENLQNAFGVLAPGESEKLLDELKDVDFKYTDSILGRIQKYYPEELGTLSQYASRQLQAGYEKPMNSYQEDVILNTVVSGDFDEDVLRWTRTRQGVDGEPGAFMSAIGGAKSSEEIVSQAIKNLHDNKDISSYTKLRSIYNRLDESSEYGLIKNTELFLDQYEKDLIMNPIKQYVDSVDLDSYTKKSTTSDELIIDQSKINPEDFISGFESLSRADKEIARQRLSNSLSNKLESETVNDIASNEEDYKELFGKIGDKMQAQLENSSDLYASSQEELNAAANSINDKYEVQLFNKRNKLDKAFENKNDELVELYQSGGLSDKEYDDQFNKLNSEYKTSFDSLVDNLNKEYKNEINSSVLSIEQKYKDGLNKEIQSLYKDYKLTPEEQKKYSEIYEKAREKLNENRLRYLIPEGSSPDASISALSGFYQSFKNEIGRQLADAAVSTGSKDLGEYARGLENRYQLPKYDAGEAPFSIRAGKIASSVPSFAATALTTGTLQKVTSPLMKLGMPGKVAGIAINLIGGALTGGATETAQMMSTTRRNAINTGKTTEEANKLADEIFDAQVANFYIYGLDALPFMKGAFKGINKIIPNRYIAGATKIGVGAGFESVTETGQETVQTAFETQIEESFKTTGVASYKDFEDNVNLNLIKETFLEVYPSTMLMGGGSQALTISKDEVDIWKEAAKNPKNIQRAIDVASITQSVDSKKALNQKVMWSMLTKGKDFTKAWINAASNLHLVSNTFNGSRGITAQEKSELLNLVDSQEQTINDLNSQTPNMSLINKLVHNYIQVDINELNAELESLKGKSVSKSKRNKIQKLLDKRGLELEQIENNPEQNSNALNLISIDNQAPFVLNDKELSNVLETSNDLFSRLIDDKININLSKTGKKIVSNALVKNNVYITNEIIDKLQNTPNVVLLKTEKEWENNLGRKREESETAVNRNGKKYVYLPAASSLEDISAGSHELVHDVISPILFEIGEDKKVVFDENNRPVISEEGHNLIDGFLNRLPLAERNALEVDFKTNYQTRNDRDEYFTLYHRMLVQGNYKRTGLDKVKNLINSIIKTNGYTSGELTAKGIQNFLKDYSNDIAVGRLSDNVKTFAAKQIGKGVEIQTIKFSRKELGDSIKALIPEGTSKTEYDRKVIGKVYTDLVAGNKLHPLINNNLARFGVPKEQVTDEFYEDVKSQLFERSLQRFNPEVNDDLGGFVVNELQSFAIPDIVNQYKDQGRFKTTEQIEEAPSEGRVRPMQIAEETTTEDVIERAEEQELKVQEKTFREKIGIEKGSDIYNSVINSVRKTFGTKLPPVTDKKFRRALIDGFKRDLMKPMKDFIGKKEVYKDFIFKNFEFIIQKIPTRELVRLEQQESNKIFAELVTKNASPTQVDNAVSKGLYLLPGASRVAGPSIYRKLDTTPEQLWNFLTGNSVNINGARKTALTERLVQELAFDATMMVLKDPEYNVIARVEEISVLVGEPLPENYDAELGAIIERDPSMTRFSKRDKSWEDSAKSSLPNSGIKDVDAFINKIKRGKWGMLTGENPDSIQATNEENISYNKKAVDWFNEKNEQRAKYKLPEYKLIPIFGKYGSPENSFFVEGLERYDAAEFARDLKQESVATNEGLVYKDGTINPIKKGLEKFNTKADDNYSVINIDGNNLEFKIEYDLDNLSLSLPTDVQNKLVDDGDGNYEFYHYSFERRDVLKPSSGDMARNLTSREEANALSSVGGVVMFYTDKDTKEPGVGDELHVVKIKKEKVYYFQSDVAGFYEKAKKLFNERRPGQAFSPNYQAAWISKVMRDAGYEMLVTNWNQGKLRAQTNIEVTPESDITKFSKMVRSSSQMTVSEVILEARQKKLNDKVIRDYLVRMRGYSAKDVDQALSFNINLFESLPESFRGISGGVMSGIKLYNRAKAYREKLIKDNESIKNPQLSESEIKAKVAKKFTELKDSVKYGTKTNKQIDDDVRKFRNKEESNNNKRKAKLTAAQVNDRVRAFRENLQDEKKTKAGIRDKAILRFEEKERRDNKKREPIMSDQEIMDKAIEFLEKQPEYLAERETYTVGSEKKGTKQTKFRERLTESQASLVSDFQSNLGVRPTKSVAEKIRKSKLMLRDRKSKEISIDKIKNELKRFIRRALPKELYTKPQVMDLIDLVVAAKESNIENVLKEVEERVTEINNKNLTQKISKIFDLKQYAKKDKNGKIIKGRRIDPETLKRLEGIVKNQIDPSMDEADLLKAVEEKIESLQKQINELKSDANLSAKDALKIVDLTIAMEYNQSLLMSNKDVYKTALLDNVHNTLNEIVTFGRSLLLDRINKRKNSFVSLLERSYYDITGINIDMSQKNAKDELDAMRTSMENKSKKDAVDNRLKGIFRRLKRISDNGIEDLTGYMSIISTLPGDLFEGEMQEIVVDRMNASTRLEKGRMIQIKEVLRAKLTEIYGKEWEKSMQDSRKKLKETEAILGYPLSRDEIAYLYNQYKDPSNHPNFESRYGAKYAETMDKLFEFLTKEDKAFADYLVNELFPSLYEYYNPIYKRMFDAEMPWSMLYGGPMVYDNVPKTEFDLRQGTTSFHRSMAPGSLIKRVNNKLRISEESNISNMTSYIQEMEYWAAYAESIRDIERLFKNEYIESAIISIHGPKLMRLINESIDVISKKGGKISSWDKFINGTNSVFSVTRLALAPVIYLKQLTSAFAYANDIGYRNWAKYSIKNIIEFRKLSNEIMENSVYLKDRYDKSIVRTIEAYNSTNSVFQTQKVFIGGKGISADDAVSFMMGLVTAGDRHAILIGGMPNYKFYKDEYMKKNPGATEQNAIDYAIIKFEKDTKKAQQSSDLQDKDLTQTGNPIMRGFNLFLSSPKQYLRKEFYAIRQIHTKISQWDRMAGKGTLGQNLRTLFTFHVVLPMIFQYVTAGLPGLLADWDEEDEENLLRAAILGNINGLFVVGDFLNAVADLVQDKPWAGNFKNLSVFTMLSEGFDYYKKYDQLKPGPKKDEALNKFLFKVSQLGTIQKWIENLEKLPESKSVNEAIMRLLNYSEYQISGGKKSKNKNYVPFEQQGVYEPPLVK